MQHVAHKLKSTRGASMVFALLVFALCALAGVVTLVAAAANIGRYTHLVQEEQQYLSAASALDVLQGKLGAIEKKVKVRYTMTESWYYALDGDTMKRYDEDDTYTLVQLTQAEDPTLTDPSGHFEQLLLINYVPQAWYDAVAPGPLAKPGYPTWDEGTNNKTCTVTLQPTGVAPDPAEDLYPVYVTARPLVLAPGTGLTAGAPVDTNAFALQMTLEARTANGRSVYPVTAVWMPDIETETETTTETTGEYPPNPAVPSGADSRGKRVTTTTLTVTLRWTADNRTVTFG